MMLTNYLTSIIIYMVIIYCEIKVFMSNIIKNGWTTETSNQKVRIGPLFLLSAIPVVRLVLAISLCIIFIYPKEKMDELMEETKNGWSN